MKIHHLNCGTMCPRAFGLGDNRRFVCHCLLIETESGLVLVDTGIGRQDIEHGLGWMFNVSCRPVLDPAECAHAQLEALGYSADDVRHIVATHLDLDHAGGLADFPQATVHVHELEREASLKRNRNGKMRYVPRQWAHDVSWQTYTEGGERWKGFEAVRDLRGIDAPIYLVPLLGHSVGHCGVAVGDGPDDGGGSWLFHCGDAYFHRSQVREGAKVPAAIKFFQNTMVANRAARNQNIDRITALCKDEPSAVTAFCAHDIVSFESLG